MSVVRTIVKNIPNAITSTNLLGGMMAILCASQGESPLWGLKAYEWAFIFIGISAVADFFDGFASRLLHAYSALGKELDSLCDMVSFGVAPAILLYHCLAEQPQVPEWLPWCVLVVPLTGALRLAKFNIDDRQSSEFIGMPIPANAIFWIGFVANVYHDPDFLPIWPITLLVILVIAALMVSPLPLLSLKVKHWTVRGNIMRMILIVAGALFLIFMDVEGLMWLIVCYIIQSLLVAGKNSYVGTKEE